jgi:conjugative transfer signal peptidase TraF
MTTLRGLSALHSGAIAAGVALVSVVTISHVFGLRVNATSSLPIGLYRTTSSKTARLVEFCPVEPFASLSAERGYRRSGDCPDGAEPLMKPIVAAVGDTIEITPTGVAVNHRILPNSIAGSIDSKNRPLTPYPLGTYRVKPGTVWVISSFNRRSFDSRYFGPISISTIRNHLQPLISE